MWEDIEKYKVIENTYNCMVWQDTTKYKRN